jgi:hypothetical protein
LSRSFLRAVSALAIVMSVAQARAADLDQYADLAHMAVKELVAGELADPRATQERLKAVMAIGVEACRARAKAAPEEAKLLDLVVAEAPKMTGMGPDALEAAWGDEGTEGDAAGAPLAAVDQFSDVRNYLDLVVHPARAHDFVEVYARTRDRQALEQAKGELVEVIEHVNLLRKR